MKYQYRLKFKLNNFLFTSIIIFTLFVIIHNTAQAAINEKINVQGKLVDSDGTNFSGACGSACDFRFTVFETCSGVPSQVSQETFANVVVTDGIFNIKLGEGAGSSLSSLDFDDNDMCVRVELDADDNGSYEENFGTVEISAVAQAFNSKYLSGIASTSFLRSDTSDNYTSGTLTFDNATILTAASGSTINVDGDLIVTDQTIVFDAATFSAFDLTGDLRFLASGDNDDYIFINTTSNEEYLYFEDASLAYTNDPGIRLNSASGELEYRDKDASSWTSFDSIAVGASLWTDGGTYLYPSGGEDIQLGDGDWIGVGTGANQPYLTFDDTNNYFEFMGGNVGIGTTSPGSVAPGKLELYGTASNAAGPHLVATTSTDTYPVFQQLNWTHDNIGLSFDSYYNGAWISSDAGSNFQIYKITDLLKFTYDSGVATGSTITWNSGIVLNTSGNVGIGTTNPLALLQIGDNTGSPNLRIAKADTAGIGQIQFGIDGGSVRGALRQDASENLILETLVGAHGISIESRQNIDFKTANNLTPVQVVRIDTNGNVGIGTSLPVSSLMIAGTNIDTTPNTTQAIHMGIASNFADIEMYGTSGAYIDFSDTSTADYGARIGYDISIEDAIEFSEATGGYIFDGGYVRIDSEDATTGYVLCTTAHDGADEFIKSCDLAGDIAEHYQGNGSLKPGDITGNSQTKSVYLEKIKSPYSSNMLGVISTSPAIKFGTGSGGDILLALTGRVPVKVLVNNLNEPILISDKITSSQLAGIGMKSTKAGPTVGKSLESTENWNTQNCPFVESVDSIIWPDDDGNNPSKPCFRLPNGTYVGKIMIFLNVSWYEPESYLSKLDSIISDYDTGLLGGSIDTLTNLTITNTLTANYINAQNGIFSSINVGNLSVSGNLSITGILTSNQIKANELQAYDSKNIIIKLSEDLGETAFEIQNSLGESVFKVDSTGKISLKSDSENTSVGSGIIPIDQTELIIESDSIKSTSKVFLTPRTNLINNSLYVDEVIDGSFKVKINYTEIEEVKFDWWVIN